MVDGNFLEKKTQEKKSELKIKQQKRQEIMYMKLG